MTATNARTLPVQFSLVEIIATIAGRIAIRGDDVCFIDWVIGIVFAFVIAAPIFGLITLKELLELGLLQCSVAALFVTRFAGAISRSVREYTRAKYVKGAA